MQFTSLPIIYITFAFVSCLNIYFRYILPICLPPTKMKITGKKGFVTGWGRIYEGGPEPSLLNVVDVPILSNSECNNMFKLASLDEHVSDDIWVCAGYRDGGKDACDVS